MRDKGRRNMVGVPGDKGFRWLFDAAVDAMLLADPGGAILASNPSCDRLFGYAGDEWKALAIEDLIPERFRAAHRGYRAAYAAKPVPRAMGRGGELYGRCKDGSEFPAKVSLSILPETDGPVILAIVQDLSSLRRTEAALARNGLRLQEREALLALAVEGTGLAVWEWSPRTDEVYLSPEWKAQLGYRDEEMASQAAEWRSRLHPEEAMELAAIGKKVKAGQLRELEVKYRLQHCDGSYRWMQSRAVLRPGPDGKEQRLMGIQWDVTGQVQLAQQVSEWRAEVGNVRQQLVALETAKAIAHELNQPLNAVVSFADAAKLMWSQGKTGKLEYALAGAVTQAARAGEVVRDLLKFLERGEAGTAVIDLNRVVREAVAVVVADDYPGCRIILHLAPDLSPVQGDAIQIKRVMVNLLRNGAEAMAKVGLGREPITVRVTTTEDGRMAQVSVRDSGPGVDPAVAKRIFEPFFTTKDRGIGMGLATSRRIIERLGGKMWFEAGADVKGGAVFHFTLPIVTA